jgi:hypothetical protein
MVSGAGIRSGVHSHGVGRPPSLSSGDSGVSRYLDLRIDNWRLAFGCASSYPLSAVALLSSEASLLQIVADTGFLHRRGVGNPALQL